ncbi:MAG: hypothetical protein ACT6QS_12750 [Flavobacteriales bacterium]
MEKETEYLESLAAIRKMMEKSGRFFSLGGLSGILIGLLALGSAGLAWFLIRDSVPLYTRGTGYAIFDQLTLKLMGLGLVTLLLAVVLSLYFSIRAARSEGHSIFSRPALNLAFNFCLPLAIGGVMSLYFLWRGDVWYIAPSMLVFYGLALFSASRYSVQDLTYLAYAEILLGLLCLFFLGKGLLFWSIGFGLFHIIYGFANLRKS